MRRSLVCSCAALCVFIEQKKAETYYTHANVKNKNKDKSRENEKTKSDVGRARAGKRGGPTSGNKKVRNVFLT